MKSNLSKIAILGCLLLATCGLADVTVMFGLNPPSTYQNVSVQGQLQISSDRPISQVSLPVIPIVQGVTITRISGMGRQRIIRNGRARYYVFCNYKVEGSKIGKYTIPEIPVDIAGKTYRTTPVSFTVGKPLKNEELFFVTVASDMEKAYVGQELDLSIQIYVKPFYQRRYRQLFTIGNMWESIDFSKSKFGVFKDILKAAQKNGRLIKTNNNVIVNDKNGNAHQYYMYELKTKMIPKHPGEIKFDDILLYMNYPVKVSLDQFGFDTSWRIESSKRIKATVKATPVKILPIPTKGRPGTFNGVLGKYEIKTTILPTIVHVGEPITLTIKVTGKGRLDTLPAPDLTAMKELTDNFKVPSESIAGVVRGDTKTFVTSIRPKNDSVRCVPAIPLTFLDTQTGRFMTVRSEPRAVMVKPADKLKLKTIVSSNGNHKSKSSNMTSVSNGIIANVTNEEKLLNQSNGFDTKWNLILFIAAPIVFIVLGGIRVTLLFYGGKESKRRRGAMKKAKSKLANVKSPDDVEQALLGYVADKSNKFVAGMTCDDAIKELDNWNVSPQALAEAKGLLRKCEEMKYFTGAPCEINDLTKQARECLKQLENKSLKATIKVGIKKC